MLNLRTNLSICYGISRSIYNNLISISSATLIFSIYRFISIYSIYRSFRIYRIYRIYRSIRIYRKMVIVGHVITS